MKRKNIDILLVAILVICTIVLYVVQNNKELLFNYSSKSTNNTTNVESKKENIANARDGIQGVAQPSPFITTPMV